MMTTVTDSPKVLYVASATASGREGRAVIVEGVAKDHWTYRTAEIGGLGKGC